MLMKAQKAVRSRPTRTPEDLKGEAYLHLKGRRHTAESLAKALGVSVASTSRVIELIKKDLKSKGGELVSVRTGSGWHYEIRDEKITEAAWQHDPLLRMVGVVKMKPLPPGKSLDDVIYGDE